MKNWQAIPLGSTVALTPSAGKTDEPDGSHCSGMHSGQPRCLPRVSPYVPVSGLAAHLHDAGAALPGTVDRRAPEPARRALALRLASARGRENLTGALTG